MAPRVMYVCLSPSLFLVSLPLSLFTLSLKFVNGLTGLATLKPSSNRDPRRAAKPVKACAEPLPIPIHDVHKLLPVSWSSLYMKTITKEPSLEHDLSHGLYCGCMPLVLCLLFVNDSAYCYKNTSCWLRCFSFGFSFGCLPDAAYCDRSISSWFKLCEAIIDFYFELDL